MQESTDVLLKDYDNGVLTLTFNRPKRKNALNADLFNGIGNALNEADQDDTVNVVVLAGAGGNFCSGMDLTAEFKDGTKTFDLCAEAVFNFSKPLIAAVNGIAIGGGATIPLHCDVVYVSETLKMRFPFVNLGLVPEFASSYMLQANIGARQAAELMYTAEWIDADRALQTGIATAIYADEQLLEKALEKAHQIAKWPVNSLRETKKTLKIAHTNAIQEAFKAESEAMMRQAGSPENIEAITAFIEKRDPDFRSLNKS